MGPVVREEKLRFLGVCLFLSGADVAHAQACEPFVRHDISVTAGAVSLVAADLDGDGDPDVLAASGDDGSWYENLGAGVFGPAQRIDGAAAVDLVVALDMEPDGDLDVVTANSGSVTIKWYLNQGGGTFGRPISRVSNVEATTLEAVDINGVGGEDLLGAGPGNLVIPGTLGVGWYESLNGAIAVRFPLWSGGPGQSATCATAADFEGRGFPDVVFGYGFPYTIAVIESAGVGNFYAAADVASPPDAPFRLATADLDGDGDLDLLAAYNDLVNEVAWYENVGGGAFGGHQALSPGTEDAYAVLAADLDGDGDVDVASAGRDTHHISLYTNGGAAAFGPREVIFDGAPTSEEMMSLDVADVDGDGDLDFVAGSALPGIVIWLENRLQFCSGCANADPAEDADSDSVPDACDVCAGHDDAEDADQDRVPDGCDACPFLASASADADLDGFAVCDGDCWEGDAGVFPGAPEVADGVDQDCDGVVDEGTEWYDDDGDGTAEEAGDCDDADPLRHPGATETCDGGDQDCDGAIDEGTPCGDDDGDGYAEDAGDCADGDASVFPGAAEDPANGRDDDCDGVVDPGAWDPDGDGVETGDCAPSDPLVYPGNAEVENGFDDDCDGVIDEATASFDDDGDGWTERAGDCDDTRAATHPGAVEHGDGRDEDCDGAIDEGTGSGDDGEPNVAPPDADADGWTVSDGDCDDGNGWMNPGAAEVCDGLDNDCDGAVDGACAEPPPVDDPQRAASGCATVDPDPGPALALAFAAMILCLRMRPSAPASRDGRPRLAPLQPAASPVAPIRSRRVAPAPGAGHRARSSPGRW
jgi:hypothetical protein